MTSFFAIRRTKSFVSIRLDLATALLFIPFLLTFVVLFTTTHRLNRTLSRISAYKLNPISSSLSGTERKYVSRNRLFSDLPACADAGRASSFLLVFQGRSGSTPILTALKKHSQVYIDKLAPVDHGPFIEQGTAASQRSVDYARAFFANTSNAHKTKGFKIRPANILRRPAEFASIVRDHNVRVIWSYRSNLLKQALGDYRIHVYNDRVSYEGIRVRDGKNGSNTPAAATAGTAAPGYWYSSTPPPPPPNAESGRPASFAAHDMTKLFKLMLSRVKADRTVSRALMALAADECLLPVSYESYLHDPVMTMQRVQRFLGVDVDEVHPPDTLKANDDSVCHLVTNWQDLCRTFFHCPQWRWMIDDESRGCSCSRLKPSIFKRLRGVCSLNAIIR